MINRFLCLSILIFPLLMEGQGIQFENNLTWEQIKQKAKQEKKYIFVDCTASWCVPCKKMEKEVFPLKNVGDYMNGNFISVHVQMDTAKNDDENAKAWYSDARALQQQYRISAFPSYLFFSPDGKIVHRYLQAMNDSLFLIVAANALDPNKQYYTLLDQYKRGKKDYSRLGYLANMAKLIGEDSLAKKLAIEYVHFYLDKLADKELMQKKQVDFAASFSSVFSSKDKLFNLAYSQGDKIDVLKNPGFAKFLVVSVITRENINPFLWPGGKAISANPDWEKLTATISSKYGMRTSDLVVIPAQVKWYEQKKDWPQVIKFRTKDYEINGLDTAGLGWVGINNVMWDVFFKYCSDKDTLNKAIGWMEFVNKNHPDDYPNMDTYANLLYRAGRKEEAISWEEKAKKLAEAAAEKEKRIVDSSYAETLNKMKKGLPTW